MRNKRIIFSGGGTGGHIYPAISIANELLLNDKNLEILFIGANNKMEMKIIPEHGFDILGLWISGYDRKNFLKNLLLPFKILVSFFQSILIIKNFKPQLVIGTGGVCKWTNFIRCKFNENTILNSGAKFLSRYNK